MEIVKGTWKGFRNVDGVRVTKVNGISYPLAGSAYARFAKGSQVAFTIQDGEIVEIKSEEI